MLWQRLITGPLLIALVIGVVWFDASLDERASANALPHGLVLFAFACVLSVLIAREMSVFLRAAKIVVCPVVATTAALLGLIATTLSALAPSSARAAGIIATALAAMLLLALLRIARNRDPHGAMMLAGSTLLVGVYGGVLLGFWMLLRLEHSPWILVGAVLTTKSCDIGAYFTGRALGQHKMIPWLSPKKTWEGLAGGVITASIIGGTLAHFSWQCIDAADHIPIWVGAFGGVLVAVIGQAGDLAESAFKRDAGLKDSGALLPGMGGVLDVLDSPLFAGPVVYWLLLLTSAV
jgi:phosphatidate cytidylyltransferase